MKLSENHVRITKSNTQFYFTVKEEQNMEKWLCVVCGYVYDETAGDPDSGIAPGTKFEDIPADWVCPVCGVTKDQFEKQ